LTHESEQLSWHAVIGYGALALMALGLAVEGVTAVARRAGVLRAAGRWVLLAGGLACLPAAAGGTYAYYGVVRGAAHGDEAAGGRELANEGWYRLARAAAAEGLSRERWGQLERHARLAGVGTGMVVMGVVAYLGASDGWRRRLYGLGVAWTVGAVGVMGCGMGVGGVEGGVVGPVGVHVALAGVTAAVAVAAVAVSIRAVVVAREGGGLARYWVAVAGLAVGTTVAGVWAGTRWEVEAMVAIARLPRNLVHVGLGVVVVGLTAGLGVLTWRGAAGRRPRVVLGMAGLLALALAAQGWVGVLMMYDGSTGGTEVFGFQRPVVQGRE
jgi:hypothetical protein